MPQIVKQTQVGQSTTSCPHFKIFFKYLFFDILKYFLYIFIYFLYFKIFSFKQYYSPWGWRRRTCPARAGAWASRRRWCSGWALRWAMARGRRSCGSIAAGCGYCGPACCSSHCRPAGSCSRSSAAAVAPSRSWLHIAKATIRYNCFSILVYQIREVVKRYIFGLHLLNTKYLEKFGQAEAPVT